MSKEQLAEGDPDKTLLQEVHDDLDMLESHLRVLASSGKTAPIDLVLQLRRVIIEEFPAARSPLVVIREPQPDVKPEGLHSR